MQKNVDSLALKRIKIYDEKNEGHYFSSLWENSPLVVIFIRHFGCISCRAHVEEVLKSRDFLQKNEIRTVFIGNGHPYSIKSFKEEINAPETEIYTDPSLESFDACGMQKGLSYLINFKSMKNMYKLSKAGHKAKKWDEELGDKTQMGGVVAFKKPGLVLYHHISTHLGDFDNTEDWPPLT